MKKINVKQRNKLSLMNKKAEERFLTPWMFIVWILIGVAIVIGVLLFNSAKIDVRKTEADIFTTRLADCMTDTGYLIKGITKDNVFEVCGLEKDSILNGNYYFEISAKEIESGIYLIDLIEKGKRDLKLQCQLKETAKAEEFAECSKRTFKVYNNLEDKKLVLVSIFVSTNQVTSRL